ncbi:hypothetical protein [Nocardia bovistercoris]|uniref:Uncharacterized protein n=1 Tax=Nocardia bovistercoris TaxID=2785916 RepID=A0A931IG52_9NOCA|nr:hypothetical protein [Nocardia bovistercoris]MBH0779432.1 hypothetical protein [Nocardia bovistercoris]
MTDFSVEVERLSKLSRAWSSGVRINLNGAADQIEDLKVSRVQMGLFQIPWSKYTETAKYIQDRLREGAQEATEIGKSLHIASGRYDEQDLERAKSTQNLSVDMDFSI